MKIGVIGYRNQSLKILKILLKLKYDNILVYCYKKITSEYKLNQKIIYTYDLKNLKNTDVIFITSPSKTHFKYINYFLNTKAMIFCEKPGCTKFNELYYLKNLKKSKRKKLYFNYNYIKSELFDHLREFVNNKNNEKVFYANIISSHGIFFNKKFKNNWRVKNKNKFENIFGNLGVHYINLLLWLFDDLKIQNINLLNVSKKGKDTCSINIRTKKHVLANILLSYSTVQSKEISIYSSNSILKFNNGKLKIISPRDTFDKFNMMIQPKPKIIKNNIDLTQKSLESSVLYFLSMVKSKRGFSDKYYNKAIQSASLVLNT